MNPVTYTSPCGCYKSLGGVSEITTIKESTKPASLFSGSSLPWVIGIGVIAIIALAAGGEK